MSVGAGLSSFVVLIAVSISCGFALAQQGDWRWYVHKSSEGASLHIAQNDEGDNFGSPELSCQKSFAGQVSVSGRMDKSLRQAIAKFLLADATPQILLIPSEESSSDYLQPSYSEMNGWEYRFQMHVEAKAFAALVKTGFLRFKVGGVVVEQGIKAGVERIAEFRDACRKF